ncbi:MAG: MmgE/PrpD family protein [Rhodospirillales bacterium]|nr:MmgE/PrpD family protein [Rhodospirillales bacterium]
MGSLPEPLASIAELFSTWASTVHSDLLPDAVVSKASHSLLDVAGLCLAARNLDYVSAVVNACESSGRATAIGHSGALDMAGAALVNGTAIHGEDFDDTYEGTPVHPGAVILPTVLAAGEVHNRTGGDALAGYAVGCELLCRLAVVAPTAIHRAGFHPTAVLGTFGAAAAASVTLGLNAHQMTNALGIAGSMASGIIEYLAEGTSTKRLHPGWAAQSGLKAALLAKNGFDGPRTVFEGQHGFFFGFSAPQIKTDFSQITDGLGSDWRMTGLAFKPYACGTMCQPFVDCAIQLSKQGIDLDRVAAIVCEVGEGTVHRLWEPLAEKRRPTTPYSAKFSVPYAVAVGLLSGVAGLDQFTEQNIKDPKILSLASKISYNIDPDDGYPANYSGHIRMTMEDGKVHEIRQPHLRGGAHEPLSDEELRAKFRANAAVGEFPADLTAELENWCDGAFQANDLGGLARFRG